MQKVIIDVDTGVDDAVGLMLALTSPDIQILAITCVRGNTSSDNACINTARVLQHCGKRVPIYRGASKGIANLEPELETSRLLVHGGDGLGDADWSDDVDLSMIQSEHAVNALTRIITEDSGEVTVVTFGPLTNLALAFNLAPDLSQHIRHLYVMGGNTDGTDPKLKKEFNFVMDPEAASVVLQNMKDRVTVLPRETADQVAFKEDWYTEVVKGDTANSRFISKIIDSRIKDPRFKQVRLPDFMVMASIHNPEVNIRRVGACASVILQGESRSLMNVDWNCETPNVTIIVEMDLERLKTIFLNILKT